MILTTSGGYVLGAVKMVELKEGKGGALDGVRRDTSSTSSCITRSFSVAEPGQGLQ